MNLAQKLQAYEERHAPKTHPGSKTTRCFHWYYLNMYSDGSGSVVDGLSKKKIFDFNTFEQLLEGLEK